MSISILVVFAIATLAIILFVTEFVRPDVTALIVLLALAFLEPWTHISPMEAISGFSNPATITVLAMLILSEAIRQTGAVQLLSQRLARFAGDNETKQLAVTIGVPGVLSGFVNNTPVVALLVPVISDMAHRGKTSPSKLLIPLSYASMFGGTLTLIGTSTNLLASDVSGRLLGHEFGMFEFTGLGLIVLAVGSLYLMTIGRRLLPERVKPDATYLDEYELGGYLAKFRVEPDSPVLGHSIGDVLEASTLDIAVLQLIRDGRRFEQPLAAKQFSAGDILLLRASRSVLEGLPSDYGLQALASTPSAADFSEEDTEAAQLVEVVIPSGSSQVGRPLGDLPLIKSMGARVLALRRRSEVFHDRLEDLPLASGDTLLIQAPEGTIDQVHQSYDFLVMRSNVGDAYRYDKIPVAVVILIGVVATAAVGLAPILLSALAGVVLMVLTGVIRPEELYASVRWDIIFLLAGIIPLGMALEQTGAAALLGQLVAATSAYLPAIIVLWLFYIMTGLITEVISNNASVLLLLPVAVETAELIDANPFAFVLVVTFAASMCFLGPIGYQTNLFVYGPGGYKIIDYIRVGAPLQLILSIVTVAGIYTFWGI